MTDSNRSYRVVRLPKIQKELQPLLREYASIRLQGLKESPESFFSTYEEESQFSDAEWLEKLQKSDVQTFVCETFPELKVNGFEPCEGDWAGIMSLRGPIPHAEYARISSKLPDSRHQLDTCWQIYNFYTLPQHRGSGVARMLFAEAASFVAVQTRLSEGIEGLDYLAKAYIRGLVWSYLRPIIDSYRRYGFGIVGNCTLEDVFQSIREPFPTSRKGDSDKSVSCQVRIVETVLRQEPNDEKRGWINETIQDP